MSWDASVWGRVDSSPYACRPLARRRHLLHRLDRSHRVRDHHPDPALLRPAAGRGRSGAGGAARRGLGDAIRGDGVPGTYVGPGGTPSHPACDHARQRPRLCAVRGRALVSGAVHRACRLGIRGRQHLRGAGLHGRHHDAGGAVARDGHDRRRLRARLHHRSGAGGFVGALPRAGGARPPRLAPLMIAWALAPFAFSGYTVAIPLWANLTFGWREQQLGWFFTVIGVTAAIVQGYGFGKLAHRFGDRLLLIVGGFGMAATIALVPALRSSAALYAWTAVLAFSNSIFSPAATGLVSVFEI